MAKASGYSHARREELARERGFRSYAQQRRYRATIRGASDLRSLPAGAQDARERALAALAAARREGLTLDEAAGREGMSARAAAWWLGDAAHREGGAWRPSEADRMYRRLGVYSGGRSVAVDVRGSRAASVVGEYHNAVRHYLTTGDESQLRRFAGKRVGGVELEADPDVLDEMARRGLFSFDSIYRAVS